MLIFRLLLGLSEAAFGPGVPFYLSFFLRRDELAYRTGLFISAAPLASTFASTLAYGIMKLGDRTKIQSWRLLFIVEGFPSVLVAVLAWFWIPDSPATARWLKPRECRIATLRLRKKNESDLYEKHPTTPKQSKQSLRKGLDWREISKTLLDPKSYLTAAMFFSVNTAFASMPVFSPIIVQAIGYSPLASQGLPALPHLCAFATVLITAKISDRLCNRAYPLALVALCAMIGYILLALAKPLNLSNIVRYLCLFPITAGFFSAVTLVIVWTLDNQQSNEGKGTGVALLNMIGQIGSLLGSNLYPKSNGPFFVKGHAVCAGFMALVAVLAVGLRVVLKNANGKRVVGDGKAIYERLGGDDQESRSGGDGDFKKEEEFLFML